jgi:hypothetical protein
LHEIHLQGCPHRQEPPHPLPAFVFGLHLLSIPILYNTCRFTALLFLKLSSKNLDALSCTKGPVPTHLSHLTPTRPKRRWYASHILGAKPLY